MEKSCYQRLLLKISGQALAGEQGFGLCPKVLSLYADEIAEAAALNAQIAIVIGGGNLFRGAELAENGIERITADQMGMLSTLINCLALRDSLEKIGLHAEIMCSFAVSGVCEATDYRKARNWLQQGKIILFAGGTGNPLVTTDTCASLRAIETQCDVLIKATSVDGIYTADPRRDPAACYLPFISYAEAIEKQYKVMDLSAFCQCQEHNLPIIVCNIEHPGTLKNIVLGKTIGTKVQHI